MSRFERSPGGAAGGFTNDYDDRVPLSGQEMDDKMDVITRHGFIRKVFGIVGVQLTLTSMIAYPFIHYRDEFKAALPNYQGLIILAMILPLAMMCYSMCNPSVMRTYPQNYAFLVVYTVCFGVIVGMACAMQDTRAVLLAVATTAVIVVSLSIFAMQTSYDFSGMGPYLMCAFLGLFLTSLAMSLFSSFIPGANMHGMHMIFSGLGAILFSFFIVYDVQLISGGKHQTMRFGLDEYAFAALVLYMDIINLFLHLLAIFGDRRN